MSTRSFLGVVVATGAICGLLSPCPSPAQPREGEATATKIEIPDPVREEHAEIRSALVEATKASGRIGVAAKSLARILHPHFVREEQIALPPLGLLAPLAAGVTVPDAEASEAMAMSDSLGLELPKMLEEHNQIRAAVERLRQAAISARVAKYQRLADQLALHAQTEEEVLYPAAILVGEILRARQGK